MTTQDKQHLRFIYNRMVEIHKENPNVDYMLKFNQIIEEKPIIHPKSDILAENFHWSEITDDKYKIILSLIKSLEPIDTNSSLHVYEEIYEYGGKTFRVLSSMSDDPNAPDYKPLIGIKTQGTTDLGICVEIGCCNGATKDYNGYHHYVCNSCYNHLNDQFDEDFK